MRKSAIFFLFVLYAVAALAGIPRISGKIEISIKAGTIAAQLTVSDLPQTADYAILLNTGLNIAHFRNDAAGFNYAYEREYDSEKFYEAFQYFFPNNDNTARFLPGTFSVSYTGRFPVSNDTALASEWGDWKGNIAFNGYSVRASEQTFWYPVVYDRAGDLLMDRVTYDLEIVCEDCRTIYLNGTDPVKNTTGRFVSQASVSLLLFAGDFDFTRQGDILMINSDMQESHRQFLSDWTAKLIGYYEEKLRTPYGFPVTYISTSPVSRRNAWMFVTYPSIVVVGTEEWNLNTYFQDETSYNYRNGIGFIAHELAHYYFGTVCVPNGSLRWAFLEGVTEYVSLQAVRHLMGEAAYREKVENYIRQAAQEEIVPLSQIQTSGEITGAYRYQYFPLLLTVLENENGEGWMWNWLFTVLHSDIKTTDYTFFKNTMLSAGMSESQFAGFEKKYITGENAKEKVLEAGRP
ncbi:MAG: M1 family aminopeptidase [Bacteroidia bacterium]